ncbi:MAG: hypothetical protein JWN04_833 [Myxococcaceae bacterium]|nr:hypothetical protein [Myxococcaceae bacterium]
MSRRWPAMYRPVIRRGTCSSRHHQVDDDYPAVGVLVFAWITGRSVRHDRQFQERLRCVTPLSFFPLSDLLNDERRQHRLLPSAL